ncbi:uncharacterized protein LOC133184607 [Saccostrea echinata]|uniref:uncharacterized protein LOC133184607 n=1 Tax=Saccostrea echinata TaxID=191078 RepID=UPI002A81C6E6|nr:uncharacterized protein LOC133184607 [Saccostrea echinata]
MMATKKESDSPQEQANSNVSDESSRLFSVSKTIPNFSSEDEGDEVAYIAPSPVFLKFSRPRKKPHYSHGSGNNTNTKDKNNSSNEASSKQASQSSRVKNVLKFSSLMDESFPEEMKFSPIFKSRSFIDETFPEEFNSYALPKSNQNFELGATKVHKKKGIIQSPEALCSNDNQPDSNIMEKARKYSQKIGSKMRAEKKAIAKQYFHELLHSCDEEIEGDEEDKDPGSRKVHRKKKKRKAEVVGDISSSKHEEQEYLSQAEKRHKKTSIVAQKSRLDGEEALKKVQGRKKDQSSTVSSVTKISDMQADSSCGAGREILDGDKILRDMLSMDSMAQRHEKPQRRCRQNLYSNIPKELQWPSSSESESEEDDLDLSISCSQKGHHKPSRYSPGHSHLEKDMQSNRRRNVTSNSSSPKCRRNLDIQSHNAGVSKGVRDNVRDLYNEQTWLYNNTDLSEGATAMHSSPVKIISINKHVHPGDKKQPPTGLNCTEKYHMPQHEHGSDPQNKAAKRFPTVISISDDESISGESFSDRHEGEVLEGNALPTRRSQRFARKTRQSSLERGEAENPLVPSPTFMHPYRNSGLAARLTAADSTSQRTPSRSSVKGRPLRPNRNCRQRSEILASPRSQSVFQAVSEMEMDEEMARRLQEEMDFEYAMTLFNAESQAQTPPCPRLSDYHTHDSDSPTTMLTRGMRQSTRDMDIVLESLFHEESEDSSMENSVMDFPFGSHMLVSHGVNRRGNRNRGRRHVLDWTERLLQDDLHQGRNNIPRRLLTHNRTFSSNDFEDLLSIAELLGDVKPKGISSEEATLLPEKKFHANNKMTSCSICMCDYILNERLKILPCFHEFHGECIEKWIVTNATCPICRVEVKV